MATTSEQVEECLNARQSFVVEAGAGAGKTRTLIDALRHLLATQSQTLLSLRQQVVCITYTNVAANEILNRINRDPLVRVSTIHEFLWGVIAPFQTELRRAIDALNSEAGAKRIEGLDLSAKTISYWQYPRNWEKGKVGHDDVIALSAELFGLYPKLSRIIADRFPVLFVDEYQDTHERTIKLLLDDLVGRQQGRITVGLFGDHMQQIYNTGVGKLERTDLRLIQKVENYRCSHRVIEVLNRLRPELKQVSGSQNEEGSARFIYVEGEASGVVGALRSRLRHEGWSENNEKVLMLTRKGIATGLEWRDLLDAYGARSGFSVDDLMRREDEFGELFANIEQMVSAFDAGRFGEFLSLRAGKRRGIKRHSDKKAAADEIARLKLLRDSGSVGEVIDFVWNTGLLGKPRRISLLEERIAVAEDPGRSEKEQAFLHSLRLVPYAQVASFERYLNSETPFSTNHGVKGEEYEDVLVVLDDTQWNQYRFDSVFAGDTSKSQYQRSMNLLYVSCSRARRNLVVLVLSPLSLAALKGASNLFGEVEKWPLAGSNQS